MFVNKYVENNQKYSINIINMSTNIIKLTDIMWYVNPQSIISDMSMSNDCEKKMPEPTTR